LKLLEAAWLAREVMVLVDVAPNQSEAMEAMAAMDHGEA